MSDCLLRLHEVCFGHRSLMLIAADAPASRFSLFFCNLMISTFKFVTF